MVIDPELETFEKWVRELDAWVATCYDGRPDQRTHQDEHALNKATHFIIWLDIQREPILLCREVLKQVRPYLEKLHKHPAWADPDVRQKKLKEIIAGLNGEIE